MKVLKIGMVAICLIACKKEKEVAITSSTINVINAAIDVTALKVNPTGKNISYLTTTNQVNYGASQLYYAKTGIKSLIVVSSLDTTKVLFNRNIDFQAGFYSMYISGTASNIDTIFRKEINYPYIKTDISIPQPIDSVVNVRFVNLSPNSPPLNINIKSNQSSELTNLAYKSIGNWKAYSNNKATGVINYIFEIRDSSSNTILLTYTFTATSTNRFKNVNLIIRGLIGSTGANAFGISASNFF